jgi:uncharacterized protein (DUF1800 family)
MGMAVDSATPANPKVLHVLNRLSLGIRPGDIQKVEAMGIDRYIQQQLQPDSIPEPAALNQQLAQLNTLSMNPVDLAQQFRPAKRQKLADKTQQKPNRQFAKMTLQQAVESRLLRATTSDRQLQESMVDFWFNHFNVFSGKGLTRVWVGAYEQEAIRPNAMGRFRDLLEATARHPAMLFYLDNWQNTAPNSPGARGRFQGLNENYARELLELHTLGVNGGYTQEDVIALAKILTGWGFRRVGSAASSDNGFYFDAKRHDFSDKVFLGRRIQGSGVAEVEQAFDILAKHPATARHISYQLAQYFVADQPPKALVDKLSQRFIATDGNIRDVLSALFRSPEFMDSKYYNAKFKTPYQYVVSAYRATGSSASNPVFLQNTLQQLGMPLFGCQTPNGYKNTQEAWLNPDGMTRRLSFATAIASGRMPLAPSLALDDRQLKTTLGDRFSAQTQQAIATSPPQLRAALILGSPEFMRR